MPLFAEQFPCLFTVGPIRIKRRCAAQFVFVNLRSLILERHRGRDQFVGPDGSLVAGPLQQRAGFLVRRVHLQDLRQCSQKRQNVVLGEQLAVLVKQEEP